MSPLIFIYGQDTYRMQAKLRELTDNLKARYKELLIKEIDLARVAPNEFSEELRQGSLFGQPILFIVRNAFAGPYYSIDTLSGSFGNHSETRVVIYEEGEPKENGLFKLLTKYADLYYYPFLTGKDLIDWIEQEAEKFGGSITRQAAGYLADCFGPDTWVLSSQIRKLIAFKKGAAITIKDAANFVRPEANAVIFQTLDAIAEGKKAKALEQLAAYLVKGESPFYLLTMLAYQVRNILLAKEILASKLSIKESGLHPYVFKKLTAFAYRFSAEELKKAHRKIFEIDRDVKAGRIGSELALELLVAEM